MRSGIRHAVIIITTTLSTGCAHEGAVLPPQDQLAVGTWGGENVGVIVDDSMAHVHIGCTFGDFRRPVTMHNARFSVSGSYMLRAYPVQIGPALPAQFTGVVSGNRLTLSVVVNDTVTKKEVTVGPVTVMYSREPQMGPCPICAK